MDYLTQISVVAPVYNEVDSLPAFLTRLESVLESHFKEFEIILIDDGSTDHSLEIAKDFAARNPRIKIIAFSRNYGHEIALTAGINHANGAYVIQLDADLQHPPEFIPQLYAKALEGYDIVYAERTSRKGETWLKKSTSKLYYAAARKMTGFKVPDNATNFRIINRKVINAINTLHENHRHMIMLYAYVGFKVTGVPFEPENRFGGQSKYNYRKLISLALDSIISFSIKPLRLMSIISIFISMILALYAGFILLQKLFYHQAFAEGVASVLFIMCGLFAILFLFLAVLSEYIGRILIESKNRPLYYIREIIHGSKHH